MNTTDLLAKLIPKDVDILREIKTDRIFCSRQAIVNHIKELYNLKSESILKDNVKRILENYEQEIKYKDITVNQALKYFRERLL